MNEITHELFYQTRYAYKNDNHTSVVLWRLMQIRCLMKFVKPTVLVNDQTLMLAETLIPRHLCGVYVGMVYWFQLTLDA